MYGTKRQMQKGLQQVSLSLQQLGLYCCPTLSHAQPVQQLLVTQLHHARAQALARQL